MGYNPVPDYHMHTPRCNHAIGDVHEYAAVAVQLGMTEIGMSDHSPMPGGFDKAWRMDQQELPDYLSEVESVRDQFADRLTVRIGLEADFYPGTEAYVREMIAAYHWDYVIGSVHYIGDWAFDNPDEIKRWDVQDTEDAYCDYFELVAASAATHVFDIIGHPDLIKKFGHRAPENSKKVIAAEWHMLEAVRDSGAALEISSAGLRKPVKEIYPHFRIVSKAVEMKIPFSFGSDAHAPGEVGHGMDACLAMLESVGVSEISSFESRKRVMQKIRKSKNG
ncbi:MAG: histidinol-phosphatase HisJ [Mariprofundaceae bacterium]